MPTKFILYFTPDFEAYAIKEVEGALGSARKLADFGGGTALIETDRERKDLLFLLSKARLILAKHISPIDVEFGVCGQGDKDLISILDHVLSVSYVLKGDRFSIQCRRRGTGSDYTSKDVEVFVGSWFEGNGSIPVFSSTGVVSGPEIKVVGIYLFNNVCYVGFSESGELINEHNDEYRLYAKAGKVSRSQFKLIEALRKFKITVHGGRALDLGAAPGGWSNVLLGLGMEVTAVDPAALDPVVAASPNLVHLASISEIPPDGKFDLIVDDMNIDAESSAMMLVGLSRLLGNGSNAIITLKLKKGSNPFKAVNSAIHILWQSYDVVSVASLFHNRLEVTLLLAKKG